jgi:hypothetical protein
MRGIEMVVASNFGIVFVMGLRILGCLIVFASFAWYVWIGHELHGGLRTPMSPHPHRHIVFSPLYLSRALFWAFLGGVLAALSFLFQIPGE